MCSTISSVHWYGVCLPVVRLFVIRNQTQLQQQADRVWSSSKPRRNTELADVFVVGQKLADVCVRVCVGVEILKCSPSPGTQECVKKKIGWKVYASEFPSSRSKKS